MRDRWVEHLKCSPPTLVCRLQQIFPAQLVATTARLAESRSFCALAYPSLLIAAAVVLTVFRISGTSVGMYVTVGVYAPATQTDPGLLAGTPRLFRWDEWHVATPYIVSQSKLGYPRYSPSAIGGQDLSVIEDIPNRHWSTLFKPYNWPFFALDVEHAFAARWWLIALLLLIPSYALFSILTGRAALAAAFSAALFLAPFFHWWYLSISLDVVGLAMAALACLIEANRRAGIVRWTLLGGSAYSLVCFALLLYPPFQIPTAIVIGFVGAGWLVGEVAGAATGRCRVRPILATAIVGLVAAVILIAYYLDVSTTIAAISNTAYPGQRRNAAGGAPLLQLLGGPFDFWLTRSDQVNQPEASSFLLTGVFVVPQVILLARYRSDPRIMRFVWPAIAAMTLLLAWAVLPLPEFVGKVTLLDRVPTYRVIVGIGLASSLVTFLALSANRRLQPIACRPLEWSMWALLALGAGVAALVGGMALRNQAPLLRLRLSEIAVGCVVFAVLVALVLSRRRLLSSIALILTGAVMSLPVNPIYRGLEPLESSPLQHAVNLGYQGPTSRTGGAVLSYLGPFSDGLIVSSGRPVVNATNLYPNASAWRALDPSGAYADAWNRYSGTVFLYSATSPAQIRITAPDAVQVAVNPCDRGLDSLNVTTVISLKPLTDPCLTELGRTRFTGQAVAYTYRRHRRG